MSISSSILGGGSGGSGGGSGDTVGPSSSTDNALARFDGATGKLLQDSLVTESDTGALVVPNGSVSDPTVRWVDDGVVKTGFYGLSTHWLLFASGGQTFVGLDGNNGHVAFRSNGQIRWASSTDPTTGYDTNIYRSAASELTLGTTSGGITNLLAGRTVEANTAGVGSPNILAVNETRKLLTNEGSGAENYHTLPSAAAGMEFHFYCQTTNGIRIVASAGDTIRIEGTVSAVAGFIRSVVAGSGITLVAINATEWIAMNKPTGTWTVDV